MIAFCNFSTFHDVIDNITYFRQSIIKNLNSCKRFSRFRNTDIPYITLPYCSTLNMRYKHMHVKHD